MLSGLSHFWQCQGSSDRLLLNLGLSWSHSHHSSKAAMLIAAGSRPREGGRGNRSSWAAGVLLIGAALACLVLTHRESGLLQVRSVTLKSKQRSLEIRGF